MTPSTLPGSTFEIDGNLIVNGGAGAEDWANAPQLQTATDRPSGQSDDAFGQGTKENTAVPTVVTGSIPNNKSDLTHFYVGSESGANNHIFMYLAWERVNTLGTANIDFEFNQSPTTSSNGETPVRTVGDMLITFDFASGGNVVNLGMRRWTGSAWDAGVSLSSSGFAIGAVNDPAFGQTTVTDPISGTTQPKDTFGEAAIDLTAAGVFNPDDCVSFGSAYVKSRSSTSFTAEMKDFIAPIDVHISNCPDITVTKMTDHPVISAGETAEFTIVVINAGVPTATGVTLNDPLPAGVNWQIDSFSGGGGTATITNGVLTANIGTMLGGETRTIQISGLTGAEDCGVLTNTATVASTNEPVDDQGNDSATATITVQCPDVTVVKTSDQGTISAGETAAFTITVSNAGPGTAFNVSVTDTLPAGIPWTTSTPGATIVNGVLNASIGTLAPGAPVVIHVSGLTDAADCGTLTNTATVAATNEGTDHQGNNSSTATIDVLCPDVTVSKTVANSGSQVGTINAGETAVFTITVSNNGPGTAFGVTVSDQLPDGATWTTDLPGATIVGNLLTGTIGTLAVGVPSTFHVFGATAPNDELLHNDGCRLRNEVTVAATNEDADDTGNNSAAAIILVNPVRTSGDDAFLANQAVIIPPPPPAPVGSPFEYFDGNLIVNTAGNRDWANANNLNIGIDLPSGQNDNSFGNGTKEDSAVPSVVTGSIPNNKSDLTRFYVSSEVRADGHIFMYLAWERANTLGTANIDFEFNQSQVISSNHVTPVRTVGDMLITFDFANGGNTVNLGLRRWTGSQWGPSTNLSGAGFANGAVNDPAFGQTTVFDPIANKTLAQDTFGEAGIDLTAGGVFNDPNTCVHFGSAYVKSRSSASFTAEMKDFIPPITVNITDCPDVHVRKTVGASGNTFGTINAGGTAVFTIVVSNDGAGTAQGVTLSDTLPDGVTWSEDSPFTSISIVNGHQVLTGSFGDMVSGTSFTVHVSGATDISSCGKLRNEAFVAAANEPADDQTDNRGAAIILVNPVLTPADITFLNGGGAPMLAASIGSASGTDGLTDQVLQSMIAQAIDQWRAAGVDAQQLAALQQQVFHIADLPYGELGWTRGNETWIDRSAEGWGWSVNGSPDAGKMDLLTVVTHEFGHVLGLAPTATGVMEIYLSPGVQLLPTASLAVFDTVVTATPNVVVAVPASVAVSTSDALLVGVAPLVFTAEPLPLADRVEVQAGEPFTVEIGANLDGLGLGRVIYAPIDVPGGTTPGEGPALAEMDLAGVPDELAAALGFEQTDAGSLGDASSPQVLDAAFTTILDGLFGDFFGYDLAVA